MTDDPDLDQWHDPGGTPPNGNGGSPPNGKKPNPIWDALHQLLYELQVWAGQTASLGRRMRQLVGLATLRGLLVVCGGTGTYEILTGMSLKSLAVAHPTKVALGVLLVAPLSQPAVKILGRESRRHQKRALQTTHEADDCNAQFSEETRLHAKLGRRLATNTDLPSLLGTRRALEDVVKYLRREGCASSIILTIQNHLEIQVVLATGEIVPDLGEGINWPKERVYSGPVAYWSIVRDLKLYPESVHFRTGTQEWAIVCASESTPSPHATVQLALAVTRLLEDAYVAQQDPGAHPEHREENEND